VAFFTEGKPTHGDASITATHNGASYMFASKRNRTLFEKDPEKYAPQYGGFCAYGVSVGALFPVDINTWQIVDGKLYLNLNPMIQNLFNQDLEGHLAEAEKKWPGLMQKNTM
jgi:YHS domain-containing protein